MSKNALFAAKLAAIKKGGMTLDEAMKIKKQSDLEAYFKPPTSVKTAAKTTVTEEIEECCEVEEMDVSDVYREVCDKLHMETEMMQQYRCILLLGAVCEVNKSAVMCKPADIVNREGNNDASILNANPEGMFLSEKYDGYRARWTRNGMISSGGKEILMPAWMYDLLPRDYALDGELTVGRNTFSDMGFLRRQTVDSEAWKKCKYYVFNIPIKGTIWKLNWEWLRRIVGECEQRWVYIREKYGLVDEDDDAVPMECPVKLVDQIKCESVEQFWEFYEGVVKKGGIGQVGVANPCGEGIMCVDPMMVYDEASRKGLYKMKPGYDGEAVIIGYNRSKKDAKKLGSFVVKCKAFKNYAGMVKNGVVFDLACDGMSDNNEMQRGWDSKKGEHKTYKKGTVVRFKYAEVLSESGKPRFPKLDGIRMMDLDAPSPTLTSGSKQMSSDKTVTKTVKTTTKK